MENIKIGHSKVIKSSPIMRKETGIQYLQFVFDKDKKCPLLFEAAEMRQNAIMDEFSQWLHDNEWSKNNTNALWFRREKMYDDFEFSEVYQLFLTSKKTNK